MLPQLMCCSKWAVITSSQDHWGFRRAKYRTTFSHSSLEPFHAASKTQQTLKISHPLLLFSFLPSIILRGKSTAVLRSQSLHCKESSCRVCGQNVNTKDPSVFWLAWRVFGDKFHPRRLTNGFCVSASCRGEAKQAGHQSSCQGLTRWSDHCAGNISPLKVAQVGRSFPSCNHFRFYSAVKQQLLSNISKVPAVVTLIQFKR